MKSKAVCGAVAVALILALGAVVAQDAAPEKPGLPEPLVTSTGEYVSLAVMKSRYADFASKERVLAWLDEAYKAMWNLTGRQPYDGEMICIEEATRDLAPVRAGKTIAVDTRIMGRLIEDANSHIMPFELVWGLGRSFDDGFAEWLTWNDASADWQASWKLNYAYETMPDKTFKAAWDRNDASPYQPRLRGGDQRELLSGYQLMQSRYLFYGDAYLGDHDRGWDAMTGDELHSFFLRFQREYGWEPFKQMYRTYARLQALGYDPPETAADKIVLLAAVLQQQVDQDWYPAYLKAKELGKDTLRKPDQLDDSKALVATIVPAFERWRMPVTAGKMAEMYRRFPIANPDAARPESPEAAAALVKLSITNKQPGGWMREGYGQLLFTFKNEGELPTRMVFWQARWMIGDKPFIADWEEPNEQGEYPGWTHDGEVVVPAGEEATLTKTGGLDPQLLEQLGSATPHVVGTAKFRTGDIEFVIPWEFDVPEAVIAEKLVRVEGKHMAYEITQTHHDALGKEGNDRLIRWLDEAYEVMQDLTGYTPYDGKTITIIESPDHPYYAYAGNPIIMDTTHMDNFVELVNKNHMVFGWIHELAHDFDHADDGRYGKWYMWSYGCSEAHANIKVVYAYEAMPTQDWKTTWGQNEGASYMAPERDMLVTGKEYVDKQFIFNLDAYLADPTTPWTDRFCAHVFLQRIAAVYGWDPVKKWYRTFKVLEEKGCEAPKEPEDKIKLMAAVLCETTGVDLVPMFQLWRAPVTYEDIEALKVKYPIEEAVEGIVLPESKGN
ncbi:MAG: M60 family metallopeptidase [Verrucomicrobia bacterium]|nr:M60 family metallopeptidase [Verrucomicrobiota bacterium]